MYNIRDSLFHNTCWGSEIKWHLFRLTENNIGRNIKHSREYGISGQWLCQWGGHVLGWS
jgi:hypothetical protein